MKNFGITAEEAYNLMAQGAQKGLNQNENLADTINEYSVHFSQLGLNSEDMFNALANGAKSGVFDIDKLGDAYKEFGIRAKDGSKASVEAFSALGFNAAKITKKFAKGGEGAKKAFEDVTTALVAMKDPVAQNTIGVSLFGTQFEDIGIKGLAALTNLDGGISTTSDTLAQIGAIKYDTFGEALSGIGRQLETALIIPIGEMLLPKLSEFAAWFITQMPIIRASVESALPILAAAIKAIAVVIIDAFAPIGERLLPKLSEFAAWFVTQLPVIKASIESTLPIFAEIVNSSAEAIISAFAIYKQYKDIIDSVAAAISAGVVAYGVYSAAIAVYSGVAGIASAVTTGFLTVLAGINVPVVAAIAAITLLVGAGYYLYTQWDWFKGRLAETWEQLKDLSSTIWNSISTSLTETWTSIKSSATTAWDAFKTYLSTLWESVKTAMNTAWEAFKVAILLVTVGIVAVLKGQWELFPALLSLVWEKVKLEASLAWETIKTAFSGHVSGTVSSMGTTFNTLSQVMSSLWTTVSSAASTAWAAMKITFSSLVSGVVSSMGTAWEGMKGIVSNAWEGVKSVVKSSINNIIGLINSFTAKLASISISIPSVSIPGFGTVGGGTLSMPRIPSIPQLEDGGIISNDGIYRAGEGNKAEAVLPLQNSKFIDDFTNAISSKLSSGSQAIYLDGEKVGEVLSKYLDNASRRRGNTTVLNY
jgi:phage-related minor tail protein